MPEMPPKPSPPPCSPSAVGAAFVASAKVSVCPSAPLPPLIVWSNSITRCLLSSGVSKNADPAWLETAAVVCTTPEVIVAEPLCDQPGPGAGTVPVPLNFTSCEPLVSSPFSCQAPLAAPGADGLNATVSVSVSPGAIVVPSERVVVALNAPPIGGLDFVIVTFVPPVFVSVNDFEAVPPAATLPYSSASGVIFSTPGLPAEPTSATDDGPTFVSSVSSPLKSPSAVGSKVTCTVTASPAARTLPASGAPVTKNGAPGAATLLIVNGAPPTLRNVAAEEI